MIVKFTRCLACVLFLHIAPPQADGAPIVEAGLASTPGSIPDQNPSRLELPDSVKSQLRTHGTVRILAKLRLPFKPEGELDAAAAKVQRDSIAATQDKVLAALKIKASTSINRYTYIPFLGLEVDADELGRLLALPEIESIGKDRLAAPSVAR